MKWFNNWIVKKAEQVMLNSRANEVVQDSYNHKLGHKMGTAMAVPKSIDAQGIRFTVYKATGGVVVETSMYDNHRDRHQNGLYVITSDKDLGQEIGKIITLEALKN
jgi:hypothetical protein